MATLSKAAFLSKWATLFADNSTRQISELDMRDFRQDIADSFSLVSGVVTANTTGANITLDFGGLPDVLFVGSADFATAKEVILANNSAAIYLTFVFAITDIAAVITFPDEFISDTSDPRWDGGAKTWTSDFATGLFKATGVFDGTNWILDISKAPYA